MLDRRGKEKAELRGRRAKTMRAGIAGLGIVGLALLGAVGGGSAALAEVGPDQPNAPTEGSLVIHKIDGAQGTAGDGSLLSPAPSGTPLADVEFTIWQLGVDAGSGCVAIDLTDAASWEDVPTGTAPATLAGVQAAGFCLINATGTASPLTDANGETSFTGLDLGLYYVMETDAPANVVSKAAPFYVTVPLPNDAATGGWLYDVNVYPKNRTADAPEKTINPDSEQPANGMTVGDVVEWTITQTVPQLNAESDYVSASIFDTLPTGLAYGAGNTYTVTHTRGATTTTWTEGTEYSFVQSGADLQWVLNSNGGTPDVIDTIQAGDVITVTFTTTVTEVTSTGELVNPGSTGPGTPGYGSEFNGGTVPGGTEPMTYWGQLEVTKVDDLGNPLEGAQFQVYNNYDGAACPTALPTVSTDLVATGTSDAAGLTLWDNASPASSPLGLWIANSADGPITPTPTKTYCLYETVVPAGHTANLAGQAVVITPGSTNVNQVEVENPRRTTPNLPLTGGQGSLLLSVVGLGLVVTGGTVGFIVNRRRKATATAE